MTIEKTDLTMMDVLADDAVEAYELTREALKVRVNILQAMQPEDQGKDIPAMLSNLGKTLSFAIEQQVRADNDRTKANGGMSNGTLDLERARAEVGKRLARIRAAAHSGGVPDGAE